MRLYKYQFVKEEMIKGNIWATNESEAMDMLDKGEFPDDAEFETIKISIRTSGEYQDID